MQRVQAQAEKSGFDVWHVVPGKYFIVCDYYKGEECVRLFPDRSYGYDYAIGWMQAIRGLS